MGKQVSKTPQAVRPQARLLTRVLVHASLLGACATLLGAAVVWPQWVAADGARAALEVQREKEGELQDKWDQVRALNERLYDWRHVQRRVFLDKELGAYPATVTAVAKKCGVAAETVWVNQASGRFHSAQLTGGAWADADATDMGEITPRSVRLTVSGNFDGVYRTVATLCSQQQLFVPERWNVTPASQPGGLVRAEVVGVVFVLRQADVLPKPARTAAPLAFGLMGGGMNG